MFVLSGERITPNPKLITREWVVIDKLRMALRMGRSVGRISTTGLGLGAWRVRGTE